VFEESKADSARNIPPSAPDAKPRQPASALPPDRAELLQSPSMAQGLLAPTGTAAPESAIRELLESATFRKATTLRKLLEFLWINRETVLNEYAIATQVLGRKADFDPKLDSAVRVHVLRLRQKLREYYEAEGARSTVRFTVPSGSLALNVEELLEPVEPSPDPPLHGADPSQRRSVWPGLFALAVVLAVIGWVQALRTQPAASETLALPPFWKRVLGNDRPTRLVIPSPIFLQWPGREVRVRDVRINDFHRVDESAEIQELKRRYGNPFLNQSYSVLASSLAAISLSQYLAVRGTPVNVAAEGQLALDAFANENLLFFGFPHTSRWLNTLTEKSNFRLDNRGNRIENLQPRTGEPQRFELMQISPTRRIRPQLVCVFPGKERGTKVILLAGESAAAAPFLMSPTGLEAMDVAWEDNGRPTFYEAVVMAETENDALVRARVAAFRSVPASN
jgi:hypothetical protein